MQVMRLSDPTTFFWKVIVTGGVMLTFVSDVVEVVLGRFRNNTSEPLSDELVSITVLGIITGLLYWTLGTLKAVQLVGGDLVVSNYLKRIKIPLTEISEIRGPENSSHQRIRIFFSSQTAFGNQIVFMPPIFAAKYTAETLRTEVTAAKQGASGLGELAKGKKMEKILRKPE